MANAQTRPFGKVIEVQSPGVSASNNGAKTEAWARLGGKYMLIREDLRPHARERPSGTRLGWCDTVSP